MNPKVYLSIFTLFIILSSILTLKTLKTNKMALSKSLVSPDTLSDEDKLYAKDFQVASSEYFTNQQINVDHSQSPHNHHEIPHGRCHDEVQKFTRANTEFKKIGCDSYSDLGVNPEGLIVTAGIDGGVFEFKFVEERFEEIPTDQKLNISRLDINYNGIIYAITRCGDTYYLTCYGKWVKLPGCAIDLGSGRAGEIWKIGCKKYSDLESFSHSHHQKSPEVFRLMCNYHNICHKCKKFVKRTFNCDKDENIGTCHWIRLPKLVFEKIGSEKFIPEFKRIDVNPLGYPVVTDGDKIYEYDGETAGYLTLFDNPNRKEIFDVTSDNYGNTLFVDGKDTFIIKKGTTTAKAIENSVGVFNEKFILNVSASAYAQPQLIVKVKNGDTTHYHFFTSSKLYYNQKNE